MEKENMPPTSAVNVELESQRQCLSHLADLSTEALIELLSADPLDPEIRVEISRKIKTNLANDLATRYLLGNPEEREAAFDGLAALCWVAKRKLCLWPTPTEEAQGKSEYECTREFIQDFVLAYFAPYCQGDEIEVLKAVLRQSFRYIGNRLWSRMIDEIRRRSARKNQEPTLCSIDAPEWEDLVDPRTEISAAELTPGAISEFVQAREYKLRGTLGAKEFDVLRAHLAVYPDAYDGSNSRMDARVTEEVIRLRNVSAQQARADKRQFRARIQAERASGNRCVEELHDMLSKGGDDGTLREEWITGRGRKGCHRFRLSYF
jgi:hypothetical protein